MFHEILVHGKVNLKERGRSGCFLSKNCCYCCTVDFAVIVFDVNVAVVNVVYFCCCCVIITAILSVICVVVVIVIVVVVVGYKRAVGLI